MEPTTVIADYEILGELGQGAAGAAYRARHRETGEQVALKLLHAQALDDIELQQRFVREVAVLQRLDHPKIVHHRECGVHDGKLYLAMELVDSGTLADVMKKRVALPWRLATEVAIQVCQALAHAHDHGVVHRDLKPANLFLSAEGEVKVGDFGLARDLNQDRLTIEGQTVGTCKYMAPEQVQGKAELTGALDLYALGCLLFEMLAGRPPYDGETVVAVFEKHLFAEIPNMAAAAPLAPAALAEVVTRLLAKKPASRPASAQEAQQLLEAVLAGEPLPRQSAGDTRNLTEQLKSPLVASAEPFPTRALVVLGGIVLATLLLWFLMS